MWMAEIAERAIKAALEDAGFSHEIRCSRVNDTGAEPEAKTYPCAVISSESGAQQGNLAFFYSVPVKVTLQTIYRKDTKRTVLAQMEDDVRTVLDNGIKASWDDVRMDTAWYYKGILDLTGGTVEIDNKEQSIEITMAFSVCGAG